MDFIQTFGTILLSLTIFYIGKIILGYSTTKGKNLATKSDIEEITRLQQDAINKITLDYTGSITEIQETVKAQFAKQNETIKAELSFSNQHILNLAALEREAIFEYHKRIGVFNNTLSDSLNVSVSMEDFTEIENNIKKIKVEFYEIRYSMQHLLLFITDENFYNAQSELGQHLTEKTKTTIKFLKDLDRLYTLNYTNYVQTLISEEAYEKGIGYKTIMEYDEQKIKDEFNSYIVANKSKFVSKRDVVRKLLIDRIKNPIFK